MKSNQKNSCKKLLAVIIDLEFLKHLKKEKEITKITFGQDKDYPDRVIYDLWKYQNDSLVVVQSIISDLDKKDYPCMVRVDEEIDVEKFLEEVKAEFSKNNCSIE